MLALKELRDQEALTRLLKSPATRILRTASLHELVDGLVAKVPDVLVLDLHLFDVPGEDIISMIGKLSPGTRIIAYSAESTPADATAIEKGVFYYAAGVDMAGIEQAVRAALRRTLGAEGAAHQEGYSS